MPECKIIDAVRFNDDQRRTRNALKDGDHVVLTVEVADRLIGLGIVELTQEARAARERKTEKRSEDPDVQIPGLIAPEFIAEQINHDNAPAFAVFKNGEMSIEHRISHSGKTFVPVSGDEVDNGLVRLASGIQDYGTETDLLNEIVSFSRPYLDISEQGRQIGALLVLTSWIQDSLTTAPYGSARGDTGSGKTRWTDTFGSLCFRPLFISGAITPAAIFRLQSRWHGTLVIEEADRARSDATDDVITILNGGFERGKPVVRVNKDDPNKIEVLDIFGVKLFARRQEFQDKALESRTLTEIMQETDRDDIPPVLSRTFHEKAEDLRNKLLLFRFRNIRKVDNRVVENLNHEARIHRLEPRLRQVFSAFYILLKSVPSIEERFWKFAENYQREIIEIRAQTIEGQLIAVLSDSEESGEMAISEIVESIGGNITPEKIGRTAKGLGFRERRDWVKGEDGKRRRVRFLTWEARFFAKMKRRYLVISDGECASLTGPTGPTSPNQPYIGPAGPDGPVGLEDSDQKKSISPDYRGRPATAVTAVTAVTTETGPNKVTEVTGVAGTPWGRPATAETTETTETKSGKSGGSVSEVSGVSGVSGLTVQPKSRQDWGLNPDSSPVEPAPDGPDRHAGQRNRQSGVVPRA